jgi:hypothetical protein
VSQPDKPKVNVIRLLCHHFSMSAVAAVNCVTHGNVSIDGHTIHMGWAVDHWTEDQVYGRMLAVRGRGEARILGSRLVRDYEQTTIGA